MTPYTFVFFGIVGSGKGTQVKLLQEFLGGRDSGECVYVGTGDIFRKLVKSDDESSKILRDLINAGRLMPDEETNKLVEQELELNLPLENKNLIFDGYPRTVPQCEFFEKKIRDYKREDVKIIYLVLSEDEAMKRNLLRGRHDDTEQLLRERFEAFKNKVIPAIEYFRGKPGYTIYEIDGAEPIPSVHQYIIRNLNL